MIAMYWGNKSKFRRMESAKKETLLRIRDHVNRSNLIWILCLRHIKIHILELPLSERHSSSFELCFHVHEPLSICIWCTCRALADECLPRDVNTIPATWLRGTRQMTPAHATRHHIKGFLAKTIADTDDFHDYTPEKKQDHPQNRPQQPNGFSVQTSLIKRLLTF